MISPSEIKSLRERRGWSQAELAKELGVDQATVSRIERGGPIARPVSILLDLLCEQPVASEAGAAA